MSLLIFDNTEIAKIKEFWLFGFRFLGDMCMGPFTKDVRLTPGRGGLRNPDVQLLFECDSIVLSGRRRRGGLEILV